MYWDQIANGLKQLIAKASSSPGAAPERDPLSTDTVAANPRGDDWGDEEQMTPYTPDNSGERSDSSLHLSC